MIYLLLTIAITIFSAGAFLLGYRTGYRHGAIKGAILALKQMDKATMLIVKDVADNLNNRWGQFLGFSDEEIKKAKEIAKNNVDKELN